MKFILHSLADRLLHTNEGQLKKVPNYILGLALFVSINVLVQGIADIIIKVLSYTPVLPSMPLRVDFLYLTAISVLMGYRTYTAMKRLKFDVTRNSIELGVLVECGLIVGDVHFVTNNSDIIPYLLFIRGPFIVLTSINLFVLIFIYNKLHLRTWWQS